MSVIAQYSHDVPGTEQVDVCKLRSSTLWLEWLGQNAMLVFALVAASDIFPSALQGFYWRRPENNLVSFLPPVTYVLFFKMCYFLLVSLVKDKDLSGPADEAHRPTFTCLEIRFVYSCRTYWLLVIGQCHLSVDFLNLKAFFELESPWILFSRNILLVSFFS